MNLLFALRLIILIILQSSGLCDEGCPTIYSREEWGARSPTGKSYAELPVGYYVIHHTDGPSCDSFSSCSSVVRGIQNYHMDSNGWWDIGYNFLIGGDGNVYEGRGWGVVGAHAGDSYINSNSIGVSMIGTFTYTNPEQVALDALNKLIGCSISSGNLDPGYILWGHRNAKSTSCPGDYFFDNYVVEMDHYDGIMSYEECPN